MTAGPVRRTARLQDFDYRSAGAYFITICTHDRECVLGAVVEDWVKLSPTGEIVAASWEQIPGHFPSVGLDAFVVMPNHVHGVLRTAEGRRGTACRAPTQERFGRPVRGSLATIVRSFKSASTRAVHLALDTPGAALWQRGFYEHVLRDEADLTRIRRYIEENPLRWALDEENPARQV